MTFFSLRRLYAGMCARQRSSFFCSGKRRNQKKPVPTFRVPTLRFGQPPVLVRQAALRNSLSFTAFTTLKHPQRVRSRSKGILQCPCPPIALRSSALPEGQGDLTRAIASLGPEPNAGVGSSWLHRSRHPRRPLTRQLRLPISPPPTMKSVHQTHVQVLRSQLRDDFIHMLVPAGL